jgi:hypothetical protein
VFRSDVLGIEKLHHRSSGAGLFLKKSCHALQLIDVPTHCEQPRTVGAVDDAIIGVFLIFGDIWLNKVQPV